MPTKRAPKKAAKPKKRAPLNGSADTNMRVRSIAIRLEAACAALQRVETCIANLTAKMQGALVTVTPSAERIDPPAPVPGLGTAQPFYEPTDTIIVSSGAEGTGR